MDSHVLDLAASLIRFHLYRFMEALGVLLDAFDGSVDSRFSSTLAGGLSPRVPGLSAIFLLPVLVPIKLVSVVPYSLPVLATSPSTHGFFFWLVGFEFSFAAPYLRSWSNHRRHSSGT